MRWLFIVCLFLGLFACRKQKAPNMYAQYPSPMVDYTRAHHRISLDSISAPGITVTLAADIQGRLYLPNKWKNENNIPLLIHFHGDSRVAQYAVDQQTEPWILFHCHWGSGSSAYSGPISDLGADGMLDSVIKAVQDRVPEVSVSGIYLSSWSAGYGAIRSIIRNEKTAERINGILLMDGLHCSYVPSQKVISDGGALDSVQMHPFANWAKMATLGKKSFLITHSAVFPGTYASTTETADYLLHMLDIQRQPLLAEGPVGMQQTSVATKGNFRVMSFAGNSAPDHIDHYHGMGVLLTGWP